MAYKLILPAPLVLTLTSCKKKYSCHCVTTVNFKYSNGIYSSKTIPMSQKMTKKQALSVCNQEAANINDTYQNLITNNGNSSSNNISSSTNCQLQ